EKGRVQAVNTTRGRISTEIVVVAAGVWSPRIGRMAGVTLPLVPMQHQYAMTGPLRELGGDFSVPNLRDPDKLVYFRQDGECLWLLRTRRVRRRRCWQDDGGVDRRRRTEP